MEAYRIDRFGSVDGIVLRPSDDPRPEPGQVLMRVRASSLNYRDLMVLKGGGRGATKIGVIPLSDGAGEVYGIQSYMIAELSFRQSKRYDVIRKRLNKSRVELFKILIVQKSTLMRGSFVRLTHLVKL